MKMYLELLLLLTGSIFLIDLWFYLKMKMHNFEVWFRRISLIPGLLFILSFLYIRFFFEYNHSYVFAAEAEWIFFLFMLIYMPKLLYITFYFINKQFNNIFNSKSRIIQQTGFVIAVFLAVFFIYGYVVTRDDFQLKKQVIEVDNLPPSFDGYRIVLFADFHMGNWNRKYNIMKPILKLINDQHPDIIIFGGDMVNNFEQETENWDIYFKQLQSKSGNFAVLGNHDYGDYSDWKSETEKAENLAAIKQNIRNLGFRLLLNEHTELTKGTDTLTLVGVENWGGHHHPRYANLPLALKNTNPKRSKILITHDPLHWDEEIVDKRKDIFLSLSGHTHAGQIGYIRGKIHVSPSALIFPEWDGLYKKGEQYLYVNRGIGYVGMPLRIGVPPEITLIILKRK